MLTVFRHREPALLERQETMEPERARLRDEQALAELGANLLLGRVLAGLDARARRALLDGGGAIGYDVPVIAIGVRDLVDRRFTTTYGHHGTVTHERLRGSFAVERAVPEVRAFQAVQCLSQITRRQPPWLRSRVQRDAIECER